MADGSQFSRITQLFPIEWGNLRETGSPVTASTASAPKSKESGAAFGQQQICDCKAAQAAFAELMQLGFLPPA